MEELNVQRVEVKTPGDVMKKPQDVTEISKYNAMSV